ncbi:hypothetical protein [Gymnodinialimonas sp. 57CJ19]|uniref:hypothetical protein n=1 Tax=Gymnodinialimonas sp. 57CJ19 TaxID=3138498 RepID=UPI0031343C7F
MTVKIALFLSSDGIALAHRQAAGHWAMIGETALDVPDLSATLAGLRDLAVEREGDGFEALLVLPDDQILYTSLTAPTADPELTAFRIEEGLEGLTPYAVTELEYDWQVLEEDRVKIAVVARETLDEARGFAAQYGFAGKGFAAMPPMERFPGVPTFGLGKEAEAMGFSAEGIAFGPDTHGQPEVPAAETPVAAAAEQAEQDAGESTVTDAPDPEAAPKDDAPELSLEPQGEASLPVPPSIEPQDTVAEPNAALAEALQVAAEAEEETTVQAIEDPSVSGPITALPADDSPAQLPNVAPELPLETIGDAGDGDDLLPPAPSPASLQARQRARALRETSPPTEAPKNEDVPKGEAPLESAPKPDAPADGQFVARRGPTAAPTGSDRAIATPTETSGAVPAPDRGRGSLVGQRSSRLGLAHPDDPARSAPTPTSQDHAPGAATPPAGATPAAASGSPMPRLAEQLQRVRNASKARPEAASGETPPPRPRVEIVPQPPLGVTGVAAQRKPSPFDEPPAGSAKSATRGGRLAGILKRRSNAKPAEADPRPAPPVDTAASDAAPSPETTEVAAPARGSLRRRQKATAPAVEGETASDRTFASGLLARKATKPTGGSFRTGLVLTVILLLLLALVAIWSVLFMPDSAVARFIGIGQDDTTMASGVPAPVVGTAPPVFGVSETEQPTFADEAAADGIVLEGDTPELPDMAASDPATDADIAELPDIDADLDLPPLPVIDQGRNPSIEEAEALYAEDGIWARSPERPDLRPFDLLDRVYTASIDPEVSAFDAVALPDPGVNPGEILRRFPPPPAFGTEFNLTENGLIAATPEGVLTPEGAFVVLGVPPRGAVPRPREVAAAAPVIDAEDAILAAFRPAERPGGLSENRERQILGGLTQVELSERRPSARPASPQETAAQASLFPAEDEASPTDPDAVDEAVELALAGTELAIARSLLPRTRPGNIAEIVAAADRTPTEAPTAVAAAAVSPGPAIPSNADVSRAATERNVIRLRNVNLIGVSGTSSSRRALVRLASGRFVRVTVGDRLDGGRVAAIGETTLQYVRSGRTVTLEIPG